MLIPIPRRLLRRYTTTWPCTQSRPAKHRDGGGGGRLHRLAAGGSDHANSTGRMQGQAGGNSFTSEQRRGRSEARTAEKTAPKQKPSQVEGRPSSGVMVHALTVGLVWACAFGYA